MLGISAINLGLVLYCLYAGILVHVVYSSNSDGSKSNLPLTFYIENDICKQSYLDIIFRQTTMFIKVPVAFNFGLQTL